MSTTSSVGSTYKGSSYEEYQNEMRVAKTQLGKNDFLNLLTAQMQYQDPLEPSKDSEFVAQLAQFSALEQMEAMSSSMLAMQSQSLVGKYVIAPEVMFEDGTTHMVEGVVNSVVQKDGDFFAQIGDTFVKVSKITEVYDSDYVSPENKLSDSAHLLGTTVTGYLVDANGMTIYDNSKPLKDEEGNAKLDANGEPLYEVMSAQGEVTRLGIKNGVPVAYIKTSGGEEAIVPVSLIFDITGGSKATETVSIPENILDTDVENNGTEAGTTDKEVENEGTDATSGGGGEDPPPEG